MKEQCKHEHFSRVCNTCGVDMIEEKEQCHHRQGVVCMKCENKQPFSILPKELLFDNKYSGNDIDKLYRNQFDLGEAINDIIRYLKARE